MTGEPLSRFASDDEDWSSRKNPEVHAGTSSQAFCELQTLLNAKRLRAFPAQRFGATRLVGLAIRGRSFGEDGERFRLAVTNL
jgi:hypothetical protein